MGCCSKIKDRNGRLVQGEDEVRRIWKEYFEYLYNIDGQEQVAVNLCGNYLTGEPIERAEVEVRVEKLKSGKAAGDDITGEMVKGGGDYIEVGGKRKWWVLAQPP